MTRYSLTQTQLKAVLHYDPVTGVFTWVNDRRHIKAGSVAGSVDKASGYYRVKFDGTVYLAHRLAWLYMTGEWPTHEVDHEDRKRTNNVWLNLRPASRLENGCNTKTPSRNTSGIKGVSYHKGRREWKAQVRLKGAPTKHGWFKSLDAAAVAVRAWRVDMHGSFAHHGE